MKKFLIFCFLAILLTVSVEGSKPGKPKILSVIGGGTYADVKWDDHWNKGGFDLDQVQFRVRQVGQTATTLVTINGAIQNRQTDTICASLSFSTNYEVKLRVRNSNKEYSSYSAWAVFTTEASAPALKKPTSITYDEDSDLVTWVAPRNLCDRTLNAHQLRVRVAGTTSSSVAYLGTDTQAVITDFVQDGGDYEMRVRTKADDTWGPYSAWVPFTEFAPILPLGPPTNVNIVPSDAYATVSFTAPEHTNGFDIKEYQIRYRMVGTTSSTVLITTETRYPNNPFISLLIEK